MNKSIVSGVLLATIMALLLICMVVVIGGAACTDNGEGSDEISVEQATDLLNRAVEYAGSHDLDKLCSLSSSSLTCRKQWQDAGEWDAVPAEPPEVVDTYLIPTRRLDNGMTQGGVDCWLCLERMAWEDRLERRCWSPAAGGGMA